MELGAGAQQVLIGGLSGHLEFDFDLLETAIARFGGERIMASRAIDSAKKPHRDFGQLSGLPIAGPPAPEKATPSKATTRS